MNENGIPARNENVFLPCQIQKGVGIAQQVVTKLWDQISSRNREFFLQNVQMGSWTHPASYPVSTVGIKQPEHEADHSQVTFNFVHLVPTLHLHSSHTSLRARLSIKMTLIFIISRITVVSNKLQGTPLLEHESNHSPSFYAECVELYHYAHYTPSQSNTQGILSLFLISDQLERGEYKYI